MKDIFEVVGSVEKSHRVALSPKDDYNVISEESKESMEKMSRREEKKPLLESKEFAPQDLTGTEIKVTFQSKNSKY